MNLLPESLFASDNEKGAQFYFWHEPGKSSEDKRLLYKIDATILIFKYLDSANISNAYVTGMKEDLGLLGNQFTMFFTLFTVGTTLAQIPSNMVLTKVPARIWLPGCEFLWGILTLLLYRVTDARQIYALRFFIGFLEGSCFVGMQYILGSWYTPRELGKRTAIFACCAYAGSMFSGFIQSGIQKNLNGSMGLEGWRWLFIIDAILTFVVAIFGFVFFPDTPETTRAWYLTSSEKARCVERLREVGKVEEKNSFDWSLIKRVFFSWQFRVLVVVWIGWSNTVGKYAGTVFPLWLKSDQKTAKNPNGRWSVYDINNIPTSVSGLNILTMLIISNITAPDVVSRSSVPLGLHFIGFLFSCNDGPTSPIIMTWANILLAGDAQQRAMTIACMNTFGSAVSSIVNQYGYPALSGPRFHKGVSISMGAVLIVLFGSIYIRYIEITKVRPEAEARKAEAIESGEGSIDEKESGALVNVLPAAPGGQP